MRTLIKGGDLSLVITVRSAAANVSADVKFVRDKGEAACAKRLVSRVQGVEKYGFIHARPCLCAYVTQRAEPSHHLSKLIFKIIL